MPKKLDKRNAYRYRSPLQPRNRRGTYRYGNTAGSNRLQQIIARGRNVTARLTSPVRQSGSVVRRPVFTPSAAAIPGISGVAGGVSTGSNGSKRRGRKLFLLLVLLIICCYGGWRLLAFGGHHFQSYLAGAKLLPVEHLEITGNRIIADQDIRNVAQIVEYKTGMLGFDRAKTERALEELPWVRDAEISRSWPAGIVIDIEEETPLVLLVKEEDGRQQICYMDRQRRTFPVSSSSGRLDFPVITGLFAIVDEEIRENALDEVLLFLRKVKGNNPYLPLQSISQIHLDKRGEIVVYLMEHPFPIFLGKGDIKRKYQRLVQVLKPLYKDRHGKKLIETVSYIQMEYLEDKVLVATSEKKRSR